MTADYRLLQSQYVAYASQYEKLAEDLNALRKRLQKQNGASGQQQQQEASDSVSAR